MKNYLKLYREKSGLTQKELAKKCNIAKRTYQYYETGERKPDIYIAQALADALSIDVDKLFPRRNK